MQQLLVIQKTHRSQHPHEGAIDDLIKDVKEKKQHSHGIILTMNGNKAFENSKGGIAKLYRSRKLRDIIGHKYSRSDITNIWIRG